MGVPPGFAAGPRFIRPDDLSALQRSNYQPDFRLQKQPAIPPAGARLLFTLDEVGRSFTEQTKPVGNQSKPSGKQDSPVTDTPGRQILTSLHGAGMNYLFGLSSKAFDTRVLVGTWSNQPRAESAGVLLRAHRSQYAPLHATRLTDTAPDTAFGRFGLALGVPGDVAAEEGATIAIDRLIRALGGEHWSVRIMAVPLTEAASLATRSLLLEELRQVETSTFSAGVSNRLAQVYVTQLEKHLANLSQGLALGMWRVAVYLMGTPISYPQVAALWKGLFSGADTDYSPLRVMEQPELGPWINHWVVPDDHTSIAAHPFAYQTLLNSAQLATFTNLPTRETPGFSRRRFASFDVCRAPVKAGSVGKPIHLGAVEDAGVSQAEYAFDAGALKRHAFISGVTGAGKTNTVFQILRQLDGHGIPFLIIEPAKSEYRALSADTSLKKRFAVYTVGDERMTPLRLNPFEVVGWPAVPVAVHIDLLKSCFAASFGLWTPLPQILEQCLHEIYKDRGWDIVSNTNSRLPAGADPAAAYPTMGDLALKVEVYTASLGYDDRVGSDMKAALLTRVRGLRVGGKGAMFDSPYSTPMNTLLKGSCVLELQNLGDDDDKAFFIALFFARLVEYRRSLGPDPGALKHVLVIEEAHRLLTNTSHGGGQAEQADPRGKAVESFSNLISEIRAYGQSLVIVDQVPTKLAPDVIKNTNLKIVHRIVAEDDRGVIAGATAMNDEQKASVATLGIGKAVVFEDGEDGPLLLSIARAKDLPEDAAVLDENLRTSASGKLALDPTCGHRCTVGSAECNHAKEASEHPLLKRTFAKLVLSVFGAPGARERLMADLDTVAQMSPLGRRAQRDCLLVHLSHGLAINWGTRLQWNYPATAEFAERLHTFLLDGGNPQTLLIYCGALLTQGYVPCPACRVSAELYGDGNACTARAAAADLADSGTFDATFLAATRADEATTSDTAERSYSVCNDATFELIEFPTEESPERKMITNLARRCVLCFTQQMLERHYQRAPWVMRSQLLRIAGPRTSPIPEGDTPA